MMTLGQHVERYITFKRKLGYQYVGHERILQAWAKQAMAHGETFIAADRVVDWVAKVASPGSVRNRMSTVRNFAVWLHAEDSRHQIPPRDAVGRANRSRPAPHLLTRSQIKQLMQAALSLSPANSITPQTWHYLIGLIAVTGLRASEACALRLTDFTVDGLIVRQTKYSKSRLVVLDQSTRDALNRYLKYRERLGDTSDHLFVLSTGRAPARSTLTHVFIKLARQTGLRGPPGEPGPRLHDLRHGFAVRALEKMVATDRDSVNRHILALSTYLGHVNVSSTYWYLEATPVLLRQIAVATENIHSRRDSQ